MRFPLRLSHPYVMGSFQRDSALRYSHLECSVAMPLGRTTVADSVSTRSARRSRFLCVGTPGAGHSCHRFCLHDRQVPFPSPDPLGTLGLPGIVSFHSQSLPHGGCDPPARRAAYSARYSPPRCRAVVKEDEKKRKRLWGVSGPPQPILSHGYYYLFHRYVNFKEKFMRR